MRWLKRRAPPLLLILLGGYILFGVLVPMILEKTPNGYRGTVTPFATGFQHPLDVTVGKDGALYVADFGSGKIYRIGWKG